MSCSCLCENTLLMWEVRGKWPHWFRLVESGCVITCQTMKQKTTPGATLVKSACCLFSYNSHGLTWLISILHCCWSYLFLYVLIFRWHFPAGQCTLLQSSDHLKLWMVFIVTRSQYYRATLGCGGTENSLLGCATTVWCCHINIDQNLPGIFVTSMPRIIKPVLCTYISQMVH